jgi:hypothetical protein
MTNLFSECLDVFLLLVTSAGTRHLVVTCTCISGSSESLLWISWLRLYLPPLDQLTTAVEDQLSVACNLPLWISCLSLVPAFVAHLSLPLRLWCGSADCACTCRLRLTWLPPLRISWLSPFRISWVLPSNFCCGSADFLRRLLKPIRSPRSAADYLCYRYC